MSNTHLDEIYNCNCIFEMAGNFLALISCFNENKKNPFFLHSIRFYLKKEFFPLSWRKKSSNLKQYTRISLYSTGISIINLIVSLI